MKYPILSVILSVISIAPALAQPTLFQQLSPKQTNLVFSNDLNESENQNVLAYEYFYNGGGIAVGDINNDGLPDIFFTANMKPNKLFLNMGNLQFKDITKEAGNDIEGRKGGWKTGVTMADVNGDGLLDIYVCYSGKVDEDMRRNQLFINQGNLKFKEMAKAYGLDDKSYSTQAAFFDYDNDGDLDMFLLNHSVKKIDNMEFAKFRNDIDELAGDKLYENKGGHFTDVSAKAGLRQNPMTFGLGVVIADVNQDGWQDMYVTNDYNEPDYLYINNGNGTFTDQSQQSLRYLSQFSMGADIADYNNDGLPDIITLDMLPEDNRRQKLLQLQENYEAFELQQNQQLYRQYMRNMLHLNNGDGTYSEIGRLAGVSNTDWSWCPLFADFDNDGYKDLFVTNGYLRDYTNKDFLRYWGDYKLQKAINREPFLLMDLIKAMPSTSVPNYIYRNNGNLTFTNMQKEWGFAMPLISSAAIYADLDNDGDLDIVVNNINENATLYKNQSSEKGTRNYISIALKGKGANTRAVGAKVYIYSNARVQYQELNPNRGYLSCLPTVLHFGLGEEKKVDSVKIIWPDNTVQQLTNINANQMLQWQQQEAKPLLQDKAKAPATIFTKADKILHYTNDAGNQNDFKRQLLMLWMYSKTGPVIAKADVNKDGLEDIFISGDKNNPGRIYTQKKGKQFEAVANLFIGDENESTVSAAAFFDCNGDGYPDLYVAKGGYANWQPNSPALQDELYINDGRGNFTIAENALPDVSASSKACVRPCDIDGDGDMDLFIGGRVIPGKYPASPTSYLLINNGKGVFSIADAPFAQIGMVTDAQWADVNGDGRKDLLVCGEFMPIHIFINTPTGFVNKTSDYFSGAVNGFWFSLNIADINGDGKEDIIAGNLGLNSPFHVTEKEPVELYYADFDGNGSIDPFFNCYVQGKSYPFVSRDELNEQIYAMRKKFASYKNYADATMTDIFSAEELAKNPPLIVNENKTSCFIRQGNRFVQTPLPLQAQFSMVTKILPGDFNHDGNTDLLLFGNHSDNRLKIGSIDASYGCLLSGNGKGSFEYISQPQSGLSVKGDVKAAEQMMIDGEKYIVVGIANGALQLYKEN
jgi:enediyne biosynthesis protein E4